MTPPPPVDNDLIRAIIDFALRLHQAGLQARDITSAFSGKSPSTHPALLHDSELRREFEELMRRIRLARLRAEGIDPFTLGTTPTIPLRPHNGNEQEWVVSRTWMAPHLICRTELNWHLRVMHRRRREGVYDRADRRLLYAWDVAVIDGMLARMERCRGDKSGDQD